MKVKGVETNLGTTEANGGSTVEGGLIDITNCPSPTCHIFDETSTDLVCIQYYRNIIAT